MSEFAISTPAQVFRPMPGHNPRSRQDRYRRVHYYVSKMGQTASAQLKQALLVLRNAAAQMPTPDLQIAASKQYTEQEFLPATKELVCIWIHLEAVDQGGEAMPAWLMNYLKLALYATDYLIAEPQAMDIMAKHAHCSDLPTLYSEVGETIGQYLGYGEAAAALGPAFLPLLTNARATRQKFLKESLTVEFDDFDDTMILPP